MHKQLTNFAAYLPNNCFYPKLLCFIITWYGLAEKYTLESFDFFL